MLNNNKKLKQKINKFSKISKICQKNKIKHKNYNNNYNKIKYKINNYNKVKKK